MVPYVCLKVCKKLYEILRKKRALTEEEEIQEGKKYRMDHCKLVGLYEA